MRLLRAVMQAPEELRPGKTRDELTAEAAKPFASLAERLKGRGHDPHDVAHFLNKLLFCMFAEDAALLPTRLLRRLAAVASNDPLVFTDGLSDLFSKMSDQGGLFGFERIEWFNGGLFDSGAVLPLTVGEIAMVDRASRLDWSQVEPAIFGTLFERGLDPSKRTQLGAHYTDRASIMRLIEPVLLTPLRRDLEATQARVEALVAESKAITARTPADKNPVAVFNAFLDRLRAVRVLDPACGSGNFLYLALQALKDLEREAILWASLTMNTPMQFPEVGPQAVLGIELNSYAAELARVVIWIGEIQWMIANGFAYLRNPILLPDSAVIAFARDHDLFFGVLHSTPHELWARGLGTQVREVESGFRYTPTSTFETFPFPEGPSAESVNDIEASARQLNDLRVGWLDRRGCRPAIWRNGRSPTSTTRALPGLPRRTSAWIGQCTRRMGGHSRSTTMRCSAACSR